MLHPSSSSEQNPSLAKRNVVTEQSADLVLSDFPWGCITTDIWEHYIWIGFEVINSCFLFKYFHLYALLVPIVM
jgi:hypothetical protein